MSHIKIKDNLSEIHDLAISFNANAEKIRFEDYPEYLSIILFISKIIDLSKDS